MKIIRQHLTRLIKFAAYAYLAYSIIHMIDVSIHAYSSQLEKITAAQIAFNRTCDDITLLSWPAILDNCIHYRKIAQRSVYWETFVELSKQLHPCGSKKDYHNEHLHGDDDHETDCSYLYIFSVGIGIGALFIIGGFNRQNNINEKTKGI